MYLLFVRLHSSPFRCRTPLPAPWYRNNVPGEPAWGGTPGEAPLQKQRRGNPSGASSPLYCSCVCQPSFWITGCRRFISENVVCTHVEKGTLLSGRHTLPTQVRECYFLKGLISFSRLTPESPSESLISHLGQTMFFKYGISSYTSAQFPTPVIREELLDPACLHRYPSTAAAAPAAATCARLVFIYRFLEIREELRVSCKTDKSKDPH